MRIAHPTPRPAAEAAVVSENHGARLPDIDDPRARAVRYLAKLVEGE